MTLDTAKSGLVKRRILLRVSLLVLSLWLGGIGCFAVCTKSMLAQNGPEHSCCKAAKSNGAKLAPGSLGIPVDKVSCCEQGIRAGAPAKQQIRINEFTPLYLIKIHRTHYQTDRSTAYRGGLSFLPDRGETYLRDCLLLI